MCLSLSNCLPSNIMKRDVQSDLCGFSRRCFDCACACPATAAVNSRHRSCLQKGLLLTVLYMERRLRIGVLSCTGPETTSLQQVWLCPCVCRGAGGLCSNYSKQGGHCAQNQRQGQACMMWMHLKTVKQRGA